MKRSRYCSTVGVGQILIVLFFKISDISRNFSMVDMKPGNSLMASDWPREKDRKRKSSSEKLY